MKLEELKEEIMNKINNNRNKIEKLNELLAKYNITFDEVAYMGDDLPDMCILEKVKLAGCPFDAVEKVKAAANWI